MQKNILITGGGSGIGQAIAWNFAAEGFKVYIVGRTLERLQETQKKYPDLIHTLVADVTASDSSEKILNWVIESKLDYLIHNAGIIAPVTQLDKVTPEELHTIFSTNVYAPILLTQTLLPKLKNSRVLHISSGFAHLPMHSLGPYCSSKAALFMAKEVMNTEFENTFIGSVRPGVVDTAMQMPLLTTEGMRERGFFIALKEQNRVLPPKVTAKFIHYLLLKTSNEAFIDGDWDIYETSHHELWLGDDEVPELL